MAAAIAQLSACPDLQRLLHASRSRWVQGSREPAHAPHRTSAAIPGMTARVLSRSTGHLRTNLARRPLQYGAMLVITGMGVASPIGVGCRSFWDALAQGRHAIHAVERFDSGPYDVHMAAALPARWMAELLESEGCGDPCAALAIVAAVEAARMSGVLERHAAGRVALVLGTSAGGLTSRSAYELTPEDDSPRRHRLLEQSAFHVQTAAVARAVGAFGPRLTVSTACASSVHALIHARALLGTGRADAVLVGGVDVLVEELFAGFAAMGAMSGAPCAPFSQPVGMTVGEGAAFVVLEREPGERPVLGVLGGLGASADAWHATAPEPTGGGIARAVRAALVDASLSPPDIGYVNAHGTGTEANDAAECRALRLALGPRADQIPVSSTKGYFGHALGAAGLLEIVATLLAMSHGLVPPTLHHVGDRGGGPQDPVAGSAPRAHAWGHALSLSLAFGGANAVALVSRPEAWRPPRARAREDVVVLGVGLLAAHGAGDPTRALAEGRRLAVGVGRSEGDALPVPLRAALVPEDALSAALRGHDRRGLDRCTELFLGASALALQDSGLRVRGALRDRAGIIAGAPRLAWGSADAFWGSVRARGYARASAPAFSGLVMNAPAGAASRALSLRGLLSVVAAGPCSALCAVVSAADLLETQGDVDLLLAGSAFELSRGMLADHAHRFGVDGVPPGEAAACFVLARESWAEARGLIPIARVRSRSMGSPRQDPDLAEDLAGSAGERIFEAATVEGPFGRGDAMDGLALAAALASVRAGRSTTGRARGSDPLAGHFAVELVRG